MGLKVLCKMYSPLQHMPPVDCRSSSGYVGLRNGGATCYMNSVIQQLYMTPGIPDAVLSIDEQAIDEDRYVQEIEIEEIVLKFGVRLFPVFSACSIRYKLCSDTC